MKKRFKLLIFLGLLLVGLILYAHFIAPKIIKVKEYAIVDKKLPNSFNGLKIIHFSDIHYGRTTTYKEVEKIVNEINLLKPDIVIFTGDLFERNIKIPEKDRNLLIKLFKKINVTIAKYAISGDCDEKEFQEIMENADFIFLDKKSTSIYYRGTEPIILSNSFENNEEFYSIGLLHQPDEIDKLDLTNYNLVLAGHSLNGQIRIPFYGALLKRTGAQKYTDSFYKISNTFFYISNGIGTEDIGLRLFNPPSINLYRLTNY